MNLKEAFKALDAAIPPHLRANRHGENFLGKQYETIRSAMLDAERLLDDVRSCYTCASKAASAATRDDDLPDNILPRIDEWLGG